MKLFRRVAKKKRSQSGQLPTSSNVPSPSDRAVVDASTTSRVPSAAPTVDVEILSYNASDSNDGLRDKQKEELPASVVLAKDKLKKAVEKLEKKIPSDFQGKATFEVPGGADINSLTDDIGSKLVTMMDLRNNQSKKRVQNFVIDWAKKTIPFIQPGLTVASVRSLL